MHTSGKFKVALAAACGICLALAAAQPRAEELRRCEDASGRVTYSNQACPTGTSKERPVELRPPVEVPRDGGAEKATRTGVLKRSAAPDPGRDRSPETVSELAREQNKAQVARCDDLVHRIEYGQQDLLTATGSERASMELGVRRLQDEYQANCARR
jgi:hypothetical protein